MIRREVIGAAAAAAAMVVGVSGCAFVPGSGGSVLAAPASGMAAPDAKAGDAPGPALAALEQLPVKGRAPKTGYARSQFGIAWTDANTALWGGNC